MSLDSAQLLGLFPRFSDLRIAVIGDLILDHYLRGEVERTSPEAPVAVVHLADERHLLGGAANVAKNLRSLGVQCRLVGVVGKDAPGRQLSSLLRQRGINPNDLLISSDRPTIQKTRVLAQGQQLIRLDREVIRPLSDKDARRVRSLIRRVLNEVDGVVISDYGKGLLSREILREIIDGCRRKKIKVTGDPKGTSFEKYRGITALTPNLKEAQTASGIAINDDSSLRAAGEKILEQIRSKALLITRGKDGVSLFVPRHAPRTLPVRAREVFDVTGAGDTFIALFSLGLFAGLNFVNAAELGNLGASIVVGKIGAASVDRDELLQAVQPSMVAAKLRTVDKLKPVLEQARRERKTVVFTNGCFDLLHPGHIQFLEAARELGDLLIVGLNSDASVRRLKGAPRPILPEHDRVGMISALSCVDYVVVFSEDTPLRLLRKLRPAILAKGKNIPADEVVGHGFVQSYGGRVVRLPLFANLSTASFIETLSQTNSGPRKSRTGRKR